MADVAKAAIAECLGGPHSQYRDLAHIKEAAAALYQTGACMLCVLRFLQISFGPVYQQQLESDITQELGIAESETASNGRPPCPVCLGILCHGAVDQVVKKYQAEQFDAREVFIGVELPKSINVRHRAMQIHCWRNIPVLAPAADVADVKDTVKYMISQQLSRDAGVTIVGEGDMQVDVAFAHPESASDHKFLFDHAESTPAPASKPTRGRRRGGPPGTDAGESKAAVIDALAACSDAEFSARYACPPPPVKSVAALSAVTLKRASLFIGGRYLKLERNISQTPFVIEGRRVTEHSVAELVGEPIMRLTNCDSYNLVGSGREDADVRMLGDGRPFYIECVNPRIGCPPSSQVAGIEHEMVARNSPVQVRSLQVIRPADTAVIKEGEESKTKHYCALVWIAKQLSAAQIAEINEMGKHVVELQQKTPVRVLHRRAPLTRPKRLLSLNIEHLEGLFYRVRIESEAGAYIKEFVHGDLGRTVPSLAEMAGATADILELDVEKVSLDFPPVHAN
ncbi:hypothetical protein GGF43_000243 [Coemansia sp. RSA 2618]|nr:hypothetical protein GGF43_000243 [Coemansia sp. RSA 2618]